MTATRVDIVVAGGGDGCGGEARLAGGAIGVCAVSGSSTSGSVRSCVGEVSAASPSSGAVGFSRRKRWNIGAIRCRYWSTNH